MTVLYANLNKLAKNLKSFQRCS